MKIVPLAGALIVASLLDTTSARASLIGADAVCHGDFSFTCDPSPAIVNGGPEFILSFDGPFFEIDIGAKSIRLEALASFELNTVFNVTLSDLYWIDFPASRLVGIENFVTTAESGVSVADITFGGHSVVIDLDDTDWSRGDYLLFDAVAALIPLPAALPLLLGGLAGLGLLARRRSVA